MNLRCPDCALPLSPQEFDGLHLDVCSGCAGIWFEADELKQLKSKGPQSFSALDAQHVPSAGMASNPSSKRPCPHCRQPMFTYRYLYTTPVQLDSCETCGGVWIEHGELTAMQQAMQVEQAKGPVTDAQVEAYSHIANLEQMTDIHKERAASIWRKLARNRFMSGLTGL